MSYLLPDLRDASDDELIQRHDDLAPRTVASARYYLDELSRRDQARATQEMLNSTTAIHRLTWAITGLTIVNVAAAIIAAAS